MLVSCIETCCLEQHAVGWNVDLIIPYKVDVIIR